MRPNELLAQSYDTQTILLKEAEAKRAADLTASLESMLSFHDERNDKLKHVWDADSFVDALNYIGHGIGGGSFCLGRKRNDTELVTTSPPYESFRNTDGVYHSHVSRVGLASTPTPELGVYQEVYMINLLKEGESELNTSNSVYGVLDKGRNGQESGRYLFFKLLPDKPAYENEEPDPAIVRAELLDPREKDAVIDELIKAGNSLGDKDLNYTLTARAIGTKALESHDTRRSI